MRDTAEIEARIRADIADSKYYAGNVRPNWTDADILAILDELRDLRAALSQSRAASAPASPEWYAHMAAAEDGQEISGGIKHPDAPRAASGDMRERARNAANKLMSEEARQIIWKYNRLNEKSGGGYLKNVQKELASLLLDTIAAALAAERERTIAQCENVAYGYGPEVGNAVAAIRSQT